MLLGEGQCVISTVVFWTLMCSRGAMAVPDEEVEEVFKLFDQAAMKNGFGPLFFFAAQRKGY